jgi:uncharacterized pyridoxal phosphate-containing UPF0001 family protein
MSAIKENLLTVMEKIEKAARKIGRNPNEIKLVAVSKTVEAARIKEAIEAGVSILGENYVQEAQKKIEEIGRPACTERFGEGRPVSCIYWAPSIEQSKICNSSLRYDTLYR